MPELRRILQHFCCENRVAMNATKDDLLQVLVDLNEEKSITAQERV